MVDCKYWKECGIIGGGCCSEKHYGGQPSIGICNNRCKNRVPLTIMGKISKKIDKIKGKGLGDLVESITTALGVKRVVEKVAEKTGKECGCSKRKDALNKLVPFEKKDNIS